jgi:hypothetical protein
MITCEKSIIGKVENSKDSDGPRPFAPNRYYVFYKLKEQKKLYGYIKCHAGHVLNIYRRHNPDQKKRVYYFGEKHNK